MRFSLRFAKSIALVLVVVCVAVRAQTPGKYSNVGRTPTQQEIRAWDIAVGPDGAGLPPGKGSAKEGAEIYSKKCLGCHGRNLEGVGLGQPNPVGPPLVGGKG